jgi:Xaa-Pro aminopeptidase
MQVITNKISRMNATSTTISPEEYRGRLESLQAQVRASELDLFIVSSFDSIYYLCGAGFEPLERPFFLLVRAEGAPVLLVPRLDQEHMGKAHNISAENIHPYWEYPAPAGRNWPDRLRQEIGSAGVISIEPGIYLRDAGGFRHSDTVLVTEDGFESLTKYPDALDDLLLPRWRPVPGLKDQLGASCTGSPTTPTPCESRGK